MAQQILSNTGRRKSATAQVFLYAKLLSLRTAIPPQDIVCGYFEHAMGMFESGPESTVFVGDSIKDGERARDCGIAFIGRTGLVTEDEFRETFGQIPVIFALEELLHILRLTGPAPPAP